MAQGWFRRPKGRLVYVWQIEDPAQAGTRQGCRRCSAVRRGRMAVGGRDEAGRQDQIRSWGSIRESALLGSRFLLSVTQGMEEALDQDAAGAHRERLLGSALGR